MWYNKGISEGMVPLQTISIRLRPFRAMARQGRITMRIRTVVMFLVGTLLLGGVAHAQEIPSKLEDALYRASQAALIGGLAVDMVSTAQAINHPPSVSYQYCADAQCLMVQNVRIVHEFNETGWAAKFGAHSAASVIAMNVALGGGILYASHFLYKKGGVWRKVAIGLNFLKAGDNLACGLTNISRMESSRISLMNLVPAGAFNVSW